MARAVESTFVVEAAPSRILRGVWQRQRGVIAILIEEIAEIEAIVARNSPVEAVTGMAEIDGPGSLTSGLG